MQKSHTHIYLQLFSFAFINAVISKRTLLDPRRNSTPPTRLLSLKNRRVLENRWTQPSWQCPAKKIHLAAMSLMQNHWILRIQRRLIYACNDAFDTVIIVDILIVSNIYTGFWGMPCLHWNHTFGKVAIDFGDVFFILKSILYLIFLRVLLWAILWTPGIVFLFLFLFSLFKTATANGWWWPSHSVIFGPRFLPPGLAFGTE